LLDQSLAGADRTGCGDVTRVTPLTLYREWVVQAARQRGWGIELSASLVARADEVIE
jgi:hypothetical protein